MLDQLHEIQREEHPLIRSISAPVYDAALNWRDAYMTYIPHYPIAEYMVDEEKANNKDFKAFVEVRVIRTWLRGGTDQPNYACRNKSARRTRAAWS